MNTNITAHHAKVRHQCFFLILCFHLVYAGVPGPCKHSVTQDHLRSIRRLIKNQLQNGCSIAYTFTERQNLSVVCYVKATFPHILDLLNTQFRYAKDSDNYRYTNSLKNLIYNIYSQRCIPPINDEIEDNPAKFARIHMTLPRSALEKAEEVIRMYMSLMTKSDKPVDWNCEEEYTEDYIEFTTLSLSQTLGASECLCTCPTVSLGSSKASTSTRQWNIDLESTPSPQHSSFSPVAALQSSNGRTKQLKSEVKHHGVKLIIGTVPFPVLKTPDPTLVPQTSTTWRSTQGDLSVFGTNPVLIEETSNSAMEPHSFTTSKELPDLLPGRTESTQSSTSGTNQKAIRDNALDSVERSTALLLAKRSLDSKSKEGPSSSYIKSPQNWVASSHPTFDIKSPPTAKGKAFQMLEMSKHIAPVTTTTLSSLKTAVHSTECLTTLVEQPGHLNSPPENFQPQNKASVMAPRNFMKTIHEEKHSKDSRSQEDRQMMKDQTAKDHPENSTMSETNSAIISFGTALTITLVCGGLLLITVLFYRKQKVQDQSCFYGKYQCPN
ncbi:macrophage colony-stimulating factor 1a [Xyrauchen texanus]|uniref:macrophage colony-stimulating factor 1a n=1 Tax=Xyrauchen texanus TaxID=154827 RepID=UPI002241D6B9|nr:macrophage colony-stimulating factor 1a [Xyrauchen texanus]